MNIESLATREPKIVTLIRARKHSIAEALARRVPEDLFLSVIINNVRKNPALAECDPTSFFAALVECASLGLIPHRNQCSIIPFKRKATFCLGYRGVIDLALRSEKVRAIEAEVVREGEHFKYMRGLSPILEHIPGEDFSGGKNMTHAYAIATLADGAKQFVVMARAEIDAIKHRSPAGGVGPWQTDYEEMAKKTVIKRLGKLIPQSEDLSRAMEVDEVEDAFEAHEAQAGISAGRDQAVKTIMADMEVEMAPEEPVADSEPAAAPAAERHHPGGGDGPPTAGASGAAKKRGRPKKGAQEDPQQSPPPAAATGSSGQGGGIPPLDESLSRIDAASKDKGIDDVAFSGILKRKYGVTDILNLTAEQAEDLAIHLEGLF